MRLRGDGELLAESLVRAPAQRAALAHFNAACDFEVAVVQNSNGILEFVAGLGVPDAAGRGDGSGPQGDDHHRSVLHGVGSPICEAGPPPLWPLEREWTGKSAIPIRGIRNFL